MQRRPLPVVERIDVCLFAQEQLNTLLAALPTGQMERRAHLLVSGLEELLQTLLLLGSLHQKRQNVLAVLLSGQMQRRLELVGDGVDLRLTLQQRVARLVVTVVRAMVESRPPIAVDYVDVCLALEDRFQHLLLLLSALL